MESIPGASWIFVCPKCLHHVRVILVMPRVGPMAECVACNETMVEVGSSDEAATT